MSKVLDIREIDEEHAKSQMCGLLSLSKKVAKIASKQISESLQLSEGDVDKRSVRKLIYDACRSFDFHGLFDCIHSKQIEDENSNTNGNNNNFQMPSFLGKWNEKELHPTNEKKK